MRAKVVNNLSQQCSQFAAIISHIFNTIFIGLRIFLSLFLLFDRFMFQLSRERDELHGQLDERAIELQNLRRNLKEVSVRAKQNDATKTRSEQSVYMLIKIFFSVFSVQETFGHGSFCPDYQASLCFLEGQVELGLSEQNGVSERSKLTLF